jgi:Glycosyl transferase family 2
MEGYNFNSNRLAVPVTIILSIWKRSYFEEQMDALLSQTCLPEAIWVIQFENHIEITSLIEHYKRIFPSLFYIKSDVNLKYFARFNLAMHVQSEYVWLLDDDIIPGKKWLETACEKCRSFNTVVCCTGRIIPKDDFLPEKAAAGDIPRFFIGDCYNTDDINYCLEDTFVDFGCNSYFMRTEWLKDFWAISPFTLSIGEDIHLSATLKMLKNIATMVPAQMCEETTGNLKKQYGRDENSSWLRPGFYDAREGILRHLILKKGWTPILWVS